jgi:putative Mn2+ efflux pump MntP
VSAVRIRLSAPSLLPGAASPNLLLLAGLLGPLAVDTFVVGAALGMVGLPRRDRTRASLVMAAFEGVMPILGFLVGAVGSKFLGQFAGYAAIVFLALAGVQVLRSGAGDTDERNVRLFARARGVALINLGLSVSVDELALGFSLGLLGISLPLAVVWIAVQALVVSQLGLRLGAGLGEAFRERAEQLAGMVLVVMAAVLLFLKVSGHT